MNDVPYVRFMAFYTNGFTNFQATDFRISGVLMPHLTGKNAPQKNLFPTLKLAIDMLFFMCYI